MRIRFNLQAIPVSLAALGLWAVVGGWYVAVAPANLAGADNIGIVLSTFGVCLFVADRLAFYWLKIECWMVFFKLWAWALVFLAWGLVEWLRAFSGKYLLLFVFHWLISAAVLAAAARLGRSRRRARAPVRGGSQFPGVRMNSLPLKKSLTQMR
jgi:hypothetical protein